MLTGDAERTARAVAREVGIEEVHARVLPDQKAEWVREFQREGKRVAFVGDGINDAPALMQADVGIAIGAGTDIAIESSDVILIGERLSAVLDAYEIGGKSYRKTVQNLWLAFLFNGVGVPLAATGMVHPVWAMIAMAASVSTVLLNSFGGRLLSVRRITQKAVEERAGARGPAGPGTGAKELEALAATAGAAAGSAVLEVPDIHCSACESRVEALLGSHAGVRTVDVDAGAKLVRLTFNRDQIGLAEIEEAITSLGFRVQRAHLAAPHRDCD
jgi:cation transport ATPase